MNKVIDFLTGKKVAILGFGKEGKSTFNYIRKHNPSFKLFVLDQNENIVEENEFLRGDTLTRVIAGYNYLDDLRDYDVIIKSPGISLKDIDISRFENNITSQIEIVLECFRDQIIGVTGTKGKSTTVSMLYKVLKDQNVDTLLLGNIGTPVFDYLDDIKDSTKVIIEMSSHQLEFVRTSPHIGIILNLFEDHLDHAGSIDHYHECKMKMFEYQSRIDYAIYCEDNSTLDNLVKSEKRDAQLIKYKFASGKHDFNTIYCDDNYIYCKNKPVYNVSDDRNLIGRHNLSNVMAVFAVVYILGLSNKEAGKSVNEFIPLEHRLEPVGIYDGVTYYNDAIATIPNATINAIESLGIVNTLIFGGKDRGIHYEELVEYLKNCNVENLICMPDTGYKIGEQITNKNVYKAENLEQAVNIAKQVTKKGMICLLSPAASSYNQFKNFEEKGKRFKELVGK